MSIALVRGDEAWVDTRLIQGKDALSAFGKALAFDTPFNISYAGGTEDVIYGLVGSGPLVGLQGLRTQLHHNWSLRVRSATPSERGQPVVIPAEDYLAPYHMFYMMGLINPYNTMEGVFIGQAYNHLVSITAQGVTMGRFNKSELVGAGTGGKIAQRLVKDEGYDVLRAIYAACYQDHQCSGGVIERWGLAWRDQAQANVCDLTQLRFMHLGLAHEHSTDELRAIMADAKEPMAEDLTAKVFPYRRPSWDLSGGSHAIHDAVDAATQAVEAAAASAAPAVPPKRRRGLVHTFLKRRSTPPKEAS